jgi:hypothetical protein
MEATYSFETSVRFQQTIWNYIPEAGTLHEKGSRCNEGLGQVYGGGGGEATKFKNTTTGHLTEKQKYDKCSNSLIL